MSPAYDPNTWASGGLHTCHPRITLTFLEEGLCQDHADEERESQDHHRRLTAHGDVGAALVESESGRPGSAPVLLVRPQESECGLRVWWREALWQELWRRHPPNLRPSPAATDTMPRFLHATSHVFSNLSYQLIFFTVPQDYGQVLK